MKPFFVICLSLLCFVLPGCRPKSVQEEKPEPPKKYANSGFAERIWVNWEVSQAEAKETDPKTPQVVAEDKKQLEEVRKYILQLHNKQPESKETDQ